MKKVPELLVLAFFTACMITFAGCKKDAENPPVFTPAISTTAVSTITLTSAETGGNVISTGGAEVISRGVCWSTVHNPTVAVNKTTDGNGSGTFTSKLSDLTPNTIYYVRAYATNSAGTAYGNEISFTSQDTPSAVTTTAIVSFTSTAAVVTGNVIYGQTGYQLIGSGVCWSTSQNPTIDDSKTMNATYSGIFTNNLYGLTQGTTYFVRAYAEYESSPTIYGNELSFTTSIEPGTGTRKADFPGGGRYSAAGFSIGTKVYLGLGNNAGDFPDRDFWEWDETTNIWTRKADFPVFFTEGSVSFSIGTKGYIGTENHWSANTNGPVNEFWEYDPATNAWTQKASIPTTPARSRAVGFSIGTKGYIGLGVKDDGSYNSFYKDLWEWDQATNIWTKKADFEGTIRSGAVSFSIGSKGYIGTGYGTTTYSKEFWEWDQATNIWTRKADFAGGERTNAVGFSIGNKGYIGTGYDGSQPPLYLSKDFWEWDQATDTWIRKVDFTGGERSAAVGVSIGSKGYIGTGLGGSIIYAYQDFLEYDPNLK